MNVSNYSVNYNTEHHRSSGSMTAATSSPTSSRCTPSVFHVLNSVTEDENTEANRRDLKNHGRKTSSFASGVRDHVKMGQKLSETLKGNLRLGAKIIQKGGRENIFKEVSGAVDGEKLLKASQCYLSTSAGPIAGTLFISTQKLVFCSQRSLTLRSSNGDLIRHHDTVWIPKERIRESNEKENAENPAQKYIHIVTIDNYEFWFMGFVRYEKAFQNLRRMVPK